MINILVVDDSIMDQKIAAGLLQRDTDWRVEFAASGHSAWQRIQNQDLPIPDAVVTDLQMPDMDGLELVREVQRKFPLLPVVLITAQGNESVAVDALQMGAASYVPKSQLACQLTSTVQQVLSLAGTRRKRRDLFQHMTSMRSSFVLSNDPTMLTSLVAHLQDILRDMGVLSENERLRASVALEEALLNAAYHGNLEVSSELREVDHKRFYDLARERSQLAPYKDRRIYIDVRIDREGLQYVIRDEGPGFDAHSLLDPTDPANLERPCGRGLLLMRTFMDEVQHNERGNEVTMVKRAVRANA